MRVEDFLSRLDGVRPTGENRWMARCPAHDDRTPSLAVQVVEDRILIHCFAGCSPQDVVSAMGLSLRDLFLKHSPGEDEGKDPGILQAVYEYRDEAGHPLYRVLRYYVPQTGKKTFRQEAYQDGEWVRATGAMATVRKVLYRLPDLMRASPDEPVWLCEGEKDVDHLWLYGLVATTNVGGARAWRAEYNQYLAGRKVYILQDNDPEGERRSIQLAEELYGIAREIKIIELPGLGPKEDISDWILRGHTIEELMEIAEATPPYTPRTAARVREEVGIYRIEWEAFGIQAEAEVLAANISDLNVLLRITALGKRILPPTRVNLLSLQTRAKLAKDLEERYRTDLWDTLIDELTMALIEAHQRGEPLAVVPTNAEWEENGYLIHPLLPLGLPTIMYGDGESGKTLTAILLSLAVATGADLSPLGLDVRHQGPVLYLDYEGNRNVFSRRVAQLARGLGVQGAIHYLRCAVPLAQDIRRIARVVLDVDPILIVVDSAALAALPGLKDPADTAKSIYSPLSQLGRTSLIIAHTPKGGDSIYGSVFFRNLARSAWFAQANGLVESDTVEVVLTHTKSNEDTRHSPIGLKYRFLADRIVVSWTSPVEVPRAKVPVEIQIQEFLRREGAHTPKEIAEELGIARGTVRRSLKELRDAGRVIRLPDGRYGLPAEDLVPF